LTVFKMEHIQRQNRGRQNGVKKIDITLTDMLFTPSFSTCLKGVFLNSGSLDIVLSVAGKRYH